MKKLFLIIFIFIFLYACGKKTPELQLVKFGDFNINISKDFQLYELGTGSYGDFGILYSYKGRYTKKNDSKSSLIIGEYKGEHPKDEKKFVEILVDKFPREVAGSKIINIDNFKKKDNIVYYFSYEIYDDIFSSGYVIPSYYGSQFYIFSKRKIYTASFVSSNKDENSAIINTLKNLDINK